MKISYPFIFFIMGLMIVAYSIHDVGQVPLNMEKTFNDYIRMRQMTSGSPTVEYRVDFPRDFQLVSASAKFISNFYIALSGMIFLTIGALGLTRMPRE